MIQQFEPVISRSDLAFFFVYNRKNANVNRTIPVKIYVHRGQDF